MYPWDSSVISVILERVKYKRSSNNKVCIVKQHCDVGYTVSYCHKPLKLGHVSLFQHPQGLKQCINIGPPSADGGPTLK